MLPLISAILLLLAASQIGLWIWKSTLPIEHGTAAQKATGNPFYDLSLNHPKLAEARVQGLDPRKVVLPVLRENLQFGAPNADITVTVLSDPACGACRETLKSWLGGLPGNIRLVYKFWPADPGRLTPGLTVEMARRKGLADKLWQELNASDGDLSDLQLLTLLEQAGLPLDQQRAQLAGHSDDLSAPLEKDIIAAQALQLPPPPILIVNGYLMDGRVLQPERLGTYLERLRADEPLVQGSDYWLMEK